MIFTEENNEMSHVLFHCRSCFYYSHDDLYRTKCPCNPRSQPWRPSRGSSGPLHLPHTKWYQNGTTGRPARDKIVTLKMES